MGANALPAIDVSTPEETPAQEEGGYVSGLAQVDVTLDVSAFAKDEDAVDALLADVERRIEADHSLGGNAVSIAYQGYALDADDDTVFGVATWAARIET